MDRDLIERFLSSRTTESEIHQLQKLYVLRADETGIKRVTVAGVLMCTSRPDELISGEKLKQCTIEVRLSELQAS